jgi:hypothetical protein
MNTGKRLDPGLQLRDHRMLLVPDQRRVVAVPSCAPRPSIVHQV